jgi:hypothetical protein
LVMGLGLAAMLAGCEATERSDRGEPGWQPTASYDKIMSAPATQPSPVKPRAWNSTVAKYEPPVVTHFGSYFEDPLVTQGDGNDTYGWTLMDLAAVGYSPARFVVNTLAVPISMVKEPPCVLQCTSLDQRIPECGCAVSPGTAQ